IPDFKDINPVITCYALLGHDSPKTFRLQGYIMKHKISLLGDGESTHNFMHESVASYLGLTVTPKHFRVLVGNGEQLFCKGMCTNILLQLDTISFYADFFILPVRGADVILGVQWLQMLGIVTMEYATLTMEFFWQGQKVILKGLREQQSDLICNKRLKRLANTQNIASCCSYCL
ncbi:RVP_2 domain-containing protein, partial [Cephalotus follicularis]